MMDGESHIEFLLHALPTPQMLRHIAIVTFFLLYHFIRIINSIAILSFLNLLHLLSRWSVDCSLHPLVPHNQYYCDHYCYCYHRSHSNTYYESDAQASIFISCCS